MGVKLFCLIVGFLIGKILTITVWVIFHELRKERDYDSSKRSNWHEENNKISEKGGKTK